MIVAVFIIFLFYFFGGHCNTLYLLSGLYVLLCQTGAIQYLPDFVDPVSISLINQMKL